MFGLGKKLREADRVEALVLERAKSLIETLEGLSPIGRSLEAIQEDHMCSIPEIHLIENGKKPSLQELEQTHEKIMRVDRRVGLLTRVLIHVEDRNQQHATGQ